jgi:hypothetical protein
MFRQIPKIRSSKKRSSPKKTDLQREFEESIDPYVNFEPNVNTIPYFTQFSNTNV